MPEIAGMKPKEAQEEVFQLLEDINDFTSGVSGEYKLTEGMNFGAGAELCFNKGRYTVLAKKFGGSTGLSPQLVIETEDKNYEIKATRFLRVVGKAEEREELKEMVDRYKKLSTELQNDIDHLKPEKLEKVEEKTKGRFRRIFTQWKK